MGLLIFVLYMEYNDQFWWISGIIGCFIIPAIPLVMEWSLETAVPKIDDTFVIGVMLASG